VREINYYSKGGNGTGGRFVAAIEEALARAARNPLAGAPYFRQTRRLLVKGFPFSVVYRSTHEELLVVAIAPHRMRPLYWAGREQA